MGEAIYQFAAVNHMHWAENSGLERGGSALKKGDCCVLYCMLLPIIIIAIIIDLTRLQPVHN